MRYTVKPAADRVRLEVTNEAGEMVVRFDLTDAQALRLAGQLMAECGTEILVAAAPGDGEQG